LINFDGCNDKCEIEIGWNCTDNDSNILTPDFCWKLLRPYVISAYISPNNELIWVNFNEPMKVSSAFKEQDVDIFIKGAWEPYEYTVTMLNPDELKGRANATWWWKLDAKSQLRG